MRDSRLTPARAMLLSVLYELVKNGEFVSEFAAEKVAYFLQRHGAKEQFKLDFQPYFYGPYSGKVRHVLYYLNGSYISGYSAKDKKPFEELNLLFDAEKEVERYLEQEENKPFKEIANKTKNFLMGFYSPFALELLSSVDYIIQNSNATTPDQVREHLMEWNQRKRTLFSKPQFVDIAVNALQTRMMN